MSISVLSLPVGCLLGLLLLLLLTSLSVDLLCEIRRLIVQTLPLLNLAPGTVQFGFLGQGVVALENTKYQRVNFPSVIHSARCK